MLSSYTTDCYTTPFLTLRDILLFINIIFMSLKVPFFQSSHLPSAFTIVPRQMTLFSCTSAFQFEMMLHFGIVFTIISVLLIFVCIIFFHCFCCNFFILFCICKLKIFKTNFVIWLIKLISNLPKKKY